jgi:hypothetical protein
MGDETRTNASGAEGRLAQEESPESAYEGRVAPDGADTLTGTRVGRGATPATGVGAKVTGTSAGTADASTASSTSDEEKRWEGGGAQSER